MIKQPKTSNVLYVIQFYVDEIGLDKLVVRERVKRRLQTPQTEL